MIATLIWYFLYEKITRDFKMAVWGKAKGAVAGPVAGKYRAVAWH